MAPKITWRQLRQVAESAQGLQSKHVGIRPDTSGGLLVEIYDSTHSAEYLIELDPIPSSEPRKLAVKLPGIVLDGHPSPLPDDDFASIADAVFWSMAAVEKFLVPYYSSIYELEEVMREIRDRFEDPSVLAFIHLPNSEIVGGGETLMVKLFAVRSKDPHAAVVQYELIPVL